MMLPFQRRGPLVVWTAAIACCFCCFHMAMVGLPAAMAESEVVKEDVAGFLDEVLNQPYKGEKSEDLPLLTRMALTKYAADNKVRQRAKTGLVAAGSTGIALAGLAPMLYELGKRKDEDIVMREVRGELPRGRGGEKGDDGSADLPVKPGSSGSAMGRRVRDFFVGPRANWGGRLWKASGVLGGLLLLAGLGFYFAKRNASKRIVENRRKYRKVLADEMRERWLREQQLDDGATGEQLLQEPQNSDLPLQLQGFGRPAFPSRQAMDDALQVASSVAQAAAAAAGATTAKGNGGGGGEQPVEPQQQQQPQQSQKAAGGVFIGADAEADVTLSGDDVRRIIEVAKEMGRPAVFYP